MSMASKSEGEMKDNTEYNCKINFKIRNMAQAENDDLQKYLKYKSEQFAKYSLEEWQKLCMGKNLYPYQCFEENLPEAFIDGILMPKEEWRTDPSRKGKWAYKVSNYGRVKDSEGNILNQIDSPELGKGWLVLEKYPSVFVYHLVAEAWLEYPKEGTGWQVHHIDNDGYNNRIDNLIYVSDTTHSRIHHPKSKE